MTQRMRYAFMIRHIKFILYAWEGRVETTAFLHLLFLGKEVETDQKIQGKFVFY